MSAPKKVEVQEVQQEVQQQAAVPLAHTPAFQLNRFKGTIYAVMNDEMAQELLDILNQFQDVPRWTFAFRQKLDQKLNGYSNDQQQSQERAAS